VDDTIPRADRLYAARATLAECDGTPQRLGIAEIVQFLRDPGRTLSADEQRSLFADRRLRDDYRRLKAQLATIELPALAAASTGTVESRRFAGGTLTIHPSRIPDQVYIVLRLTSRDTAPRSIVLEGSTGELAKRSLPAADLQGEIMMVLDRKNIADGVFLRLASDPMSTGYLLP